MLAALLTNLPAAAVVEKIPRGGGNYELMLRQRNRQRIIQEDEELILEIVAFVTGGHEK